MKKVTYIKVVLLIQSSFHRSHILKHSNQHQMNNFMNLKLLGLNLKYILRIYTKVPFICSGYINYLSFEIPKSAIYK